MAQGFLNIWTLLRYYVNQQRHYFIEELIVHVVVPRADEDSVIGLADEIVAYVVDDYCLFQVTTQ